MGTLSPKEKIFSGIRRKWTFPPWNAKSDNSFFSLTVETPLNIKIQWGNAVYFKCIKIDVFSAENISLYAKFCHIFSALKTSIFLLGSTFILRRVLSKFESQLCLCYWFIINYAFTTACIRKQSNNLCAIHN